jgi:hypothetical protein
MTVLRQNMMHDLLLAGLVKDTRDRYLNSIATCASRLRHSRRPERLEQLQNIS